MASTTCKALFDVIIVGCGPGGGATLASYLAQAGLSALALEKEAFPRYHIGESPTGMIADISEDLGLDPEMERRQFPLKGGVKVIGRDAKNEFFVPVLRPTWQVRGDEFDQILLDRAIDLGATHRYGHVQGVLREGDRVVGVRYTPTRQDATCADNSPQQVCGHIVADASGRELYGRDLGWLANGCTTRLFENAMTCERSGILAGHIGAMERQLETCIDYAHTRRQFNQPIGRFQSVSNRIVDMKVCLETARPLLYQVAWMRQQGRDATLEAAMAKLYLSEAFLQSSMAAIRTFGGDGYLPEYGVEGDVRDAMGGTLYSGTSDIQRNIIASQLGVLR